MIGIPKRSTQIQMRLFYLVIIITLFVGCGNHYDNQHVLIKTNLGDIELELFPKKAPKTVAAFLSYVNAGYYNNSSFYRVVKEEDMGGNTSGVIQGGVWSTNPQLKVPGIPHESTKETGLSHTSGTVSLARTTPGTAGTEFFICVGDQTIFDQGRGHRADTLGYAAFGTVVTGMPIVRKILEQPSTGENFDKQIMIEKIKRL